MDHLLRNITHMNRVGGEKIVMSEVLWNRTLHDISPPILSNITHIGYVGGRNALSDVLRNGALRVISPPSSRVVNL